MGRNEIFAELSLLGLSDRRELMRSLLELEQGRAEVAECDATARAGFALLEQMELEDEARGGA